MMRTWMLGPMWVLVACGQADLADDTVVWEEAVEAAGDPLPPPFPLGTLELSHSALEVGAPVTLSATRAAAGETVYFVRSTRGFGAGPCPPVLGGLCLDVQGPVSLMGSAVADVNGDASFDFTLPGALSPGAEVYLQAAVVRGIGGVDSVKSHPVVGTLVDPLAPPRCDGAISISGDSAYLLCANAETWFDGRDSCDALGAGLVTVNDATEDAFVLAAAGAVASTHWWMGYNDLANEGFFEWWDGSPAVYLNWAPGEPNDANGVEDCGELQPSTGRWNDDNCDSAQHYVCEVDVSNSGAMCDGEIRFHDGSVYAFCTNATDWADAVSTCGALGMSLASVDDQDENRFLGEEGASIQGGNWWVGLSDALLEGQYNWVDGTTTFFTNWEPNQPDNAYNEDCAEMRPNFDYAWNDRPCFVANAFICEG